MNNLAALYVNEGKNAEAEPLSTAAVEVRRRVLGERHPDTLRSMANLGLLYVNSGRHGQAESLLRTALKSYEQASPDSWERYHCESLLGASLTGQQKYAEAEPFVVDGYRAMVQRKATIPVAGSSALDQAGRRVAQLYRRWGKAAQAAEWAKTLEQAKAGDSTTPR
jgi:tetratricopeptide (TPR) repeat protein